MLVVPLVLWIASFADAAIVKRAASCSATYNPVPGFPQGPTTTVCYDTSYYRSADQGTLQGSGDLSLVLQQKCEVSCTADSNCKAIVGATQYAADSNAATGVCYFYDHTPVPRQCTDSSKRALRAESKNTVCITSTTTTTTTTTKSTTKSTTTTTKPTTTTTTTKKPTTTTTTTTKPTTTTTTTTKSTTTTTSTTTTKPTTTTTTTTKPTTTTTTTTSSTTTTTTTTTSTTSTTTTTTVPITTTTPTTTTTTTATVTSSPPMCSGGGASAGSLTQGCENGSTCQTTPTCMHANTEYDCFDSCTGSCIEADYSTDGSGDCVLQYGCCPENMKRRKRNAFQPLGRSSIIQENGVSKLIKSPDVILDN